MEGHSPLALPSNKAPSPFMGDILPSNKAPSPFMGKGHGVRAGEGRWRNTRTDTPRRLLHPNSEPLRSLILIARHQALCYLISNSGMSDVRMEVEI